MINTQKLHAMADFLSAIKPSINMSSWSTCVCGHWTAHHAKVRGEALSEPRLMQEAHQVAKRDFGLELGTPAGDFCLGSQWGNPEFHKVLNNLEAAIERIRYVAIHGDAPDASQWKRFEEPQDQLTLPPKSERELVCS